METCGSCRFYFPIDKNGNQGECRFEPPKVFVLPKGSPFAGAPPEIVLQSTFPPVKSGAWCGRYEKRAEPLDIPEDEKTIKLAGGD